MDMEYNIDSERKFEDVVASIEKYTAENSFKVLHIHDVQATLAGKGFEREPIKIIEVCNAKFASEALQKNMSVSIFMPCKIVVYTENNTTKLKAMRPKAISEFFPNDNLEEMAGEVDRIIIEITDRAAKGE